VPRLDSVEQVDRADVKHRVFLGGEEKGCPYASMGRRPVAAALLCGAVSALPALRPRKNTIACADPLAAQDFTLKYVGGLWTDHDNKYLYGHDLGTADLSVFAICSDFRS
jgi:hypothetical protein